MVVSTQRDHAALSLEELLKPATSCWHRMPIRAVAKRNPSHQDAVRDMSAAAVGDNTNRDVLIREILEHCHRD